MPVDATAGAEEALDYKWATEPKRPKIGNCCHTLGEVVDVLWTRYFGPTRKHGGLTEFVPQEYCFAEIEPRLRLAFLGDVLPGWEKRYEIDAGVREFVGDADYLLLNLEGPISDDTHVINSYRHDPSILDLLADLFPVERTVLGCANNHAADCGWAEFQRFYNLLKERGFRVLGRRDEPWLKLPEDVLIANGTERSNVPGEFVAPFAEAAAVEEPATYRVLFPHWGWEMHLYPPPKQVAQARDLITQWDMIVGHHTHCPQPVTDEGGKLLAYSLGNFCRGDGSERGQHGLALKAEIGPDASGEWRTGRVSWRFVRPVAEGEEKLRIETARECRFFPGIDGAE